jgi:ankyrin repeat protein
MDTTKKGRVKRARASKNHGAQLIEKALCGSTSDVKKALLAGARIDVCDRDGFTPLMLAIAGKNQKMATYLIEQKADVNRRNKIGQTALMLAAQGGYKRLVEQLIQAGADVRAVDNDKRNAVSWAASRGDFPEVISTLVMFNANPDTRDVRGITPLMAASLMGHAKTVAVLLTIGADEKRKFRGKTAYQMAAEKGRTDVCQTMKAVLRNRPRNALIGGQPTFISSASS